MPSPTKPKKVGRPKLPKGNAKAETLRIRSTADELRAFDKAAKASKQTRSEWIRSTLNAAVEPQATFQTKVV
jgi:uncharacterized protein (DUF1778 family)